MTTAPQAASERAPAPEPAPASAPAPAPAPVHQPTAPLGEAGAAPRPVRARWAETDPLLTVYYDTEWGVPVADDAGVFERLSLEAFQAGLSWLTVLRRRDEFRRAFAGFDPVRVAEYGDADVERLMADPGIIRNRRKILSTVANARAAMRLRGEGSGLAELVWSFRPERSPAPRSDAEVPSTSPESAALAQELKRRGFAFVGPTTVYALMTAIGIVDAHLVDSHRRGCSGLWAVDGSRIGDALPAELTGRASVG